MLRHAASRLAARTFTLTLRPPQPPGSKASPSPQLWGHVRAFAGGRTSVNNNNNNSADVAARWGVAVSFLRRGADAASTSPTSVAIAAAAPGSAAAPSSSAAVAGTGRAARPRLMSSTGGSPPSSSSSSSGTGGAAGAGGGSGGVGGSAAGGGGQATARAAARERLARETEQAQAKSAAGGMYLMAVVVAMVGATYASVPLYRMFCQATGFGGTTRRKSVEEKMAEQAKLPEEVRSRARSREVVISFNADVADGMPWRFVPTQKAVRVAPGETTLAFFTARNRSDRAITGVATYNVQPNKAGVYFNKVQCFCFEEQRLRAGEEVDMPVFFYLDPEFASDPAMADVNNIMLSYTFFRSDDFDETLEEDERRKMEEARNATVGTGGGVRVHGTGTVPPGIKPHAGA